jgi:tyrosinase
MASMKNSAHGGSGLNFKFDITDIVDELHLNNSIDLESLNVQIRTKNPIPKESEVVVGRISVYRSGQ